MTNQEAIETIEANYPPENYSMLRKALDMAIALLKEQEAVTIKKTKEPYGYGVYGGICPKCRNWIQSAYSFCGFCGQAVRWND